MPLVLHNTFTGREEEFRPADPARVTMYVCGPTVYNFAHIGNARPAVVFDVLARLLRQSYNLVYARNITDVDDKINAAARENQVSIDVITERFTAAYHEDMAALGVAPPDVEPRVTANIPVIIEMIRQLLELGYAYEAQGHVLFAVDSFAGYGDLSGRSRDAMVAGARVEVAPYKRDAADFVLWKPSDAETVGWPSPWGRGRPGWHIECSAMAEAHLGETIDIHGGGQDLIFPHHENEIAQSTCAHAGAVYSRYWVHNGFLNVDKEKMAKSLGNVLLVRELLNEAPGEAVRLALLTAHYRQPLDWSDTVLKDARARLDGLYGTLRDAGIQGTGEAPDQLPDSVVAALEDDLNTPKALAALAQLARQANRAAGAQAREGAAMLRAGGWLLGLLQEDPSHWFSGGELGELTPAAIESLLAQRDAYRRAKDFEAADRIRQALAEQGVLIEDGRDGARWRQAR